MKKVYFVEVDSKDSGAFKFFRFTDIEVMKNFIEKINSTKNLKAFFVSEITINN